jgi:hypothetical protein
MAKRRPEPSHPITPKDVFQRSNMPSPSHRSVAEDLSIRHQAMSRRCTTSRRPRHPMVAVVGRRALADADLDRAGFTAVISLQELARGRDTVTDRRLASELLRTAGGVVAQLLASKIPLSDNISG